VNRGGRPGAALRAAPAAAAAALAPPGGQARQAHREQTRERFLEAANRVFARAGFGGATTAAIAEAAGLPKANLHYWFGSKQQLYAEVLARTLHDWLGPLDALQPDADPALALAAYLRAKMALVAAQPDASRVFANELLHGAPVLDTLIRTELRAKVREKAAVIDGWIAAGRMAPVDSTHLFFTMWAATQTYADFDVQVRGVLGRSKLTARDHARATEHVVALVLRGCGLG
jgi:TetR/AcrR family transcriptional regulator